MPATGCVTIDVLNPTMGSSFPPVQGRAYFLERTWTGSKVLVCDVRPNNSVVCYPQPSGSAGGGGGGQ